MRCLGWFVMALAVGTMAPHSLSAQSPAWGDLRPGAYAAGFRLVETWDYGRALQPPTDFTGRPAAGPTAVPMQLGVWYPAVRTAAAPMTFFDLALAVQHRQRFATPTAADSAAARREIGQIASLSGGDSAQRAAAVARTLARATASVGNARAARGSFPVAVIATGGWVGATTVLAEYLATHGWIVVATASQTTSSGGQQVTEPAFAVDVGLNAIEFAVAWAQRFPGADPTRLGVVGVNFDGLSALEYQLRYMRAAAVVTINGWETIEDRAAVLRSSPWYDATRVRVPVLNVHWDEPGSAPAEYRFLAGLKYAERRSLVIAGLDHFGLVLNPLAYTFSSPAQRTGHQYLVRLVHATLVSSTGGRTDGFAERAPAEFGFPATLLKEDWRRPALPPVPTRSEFFEILAEQNDLATATRLFRDARSRDSTVQLFTEGDAGLAAFRYQRAGRLDDAIAVGHLTVEAYPQSSRARNTLGNALLARADTGGALREFAAALALLEASTTMVPEEKAEQARVWREKVARLQPARRP